MARKKDPGKSAGGTTDQVMSAAAAESIDTDLLLQTVDPPPAPAPAASQAQATKPPLDLMKLKVEKSCSRGLSGWLAGNRISLAISSYQTGRVYLVGSDKQGRVSFFERIFERAMGIVGNAQTIGDLDIHELGIRKNGKVVFVNTKYSCLAELSQTHSFKAIWKPDSSAGSRPRTGATSTAWRWSMENRAT